MDRMGRLYPNVSSLSEKSGIAMEREELRRMIMGAVFCTNGKISRRSPPKPIGLLGRSGEKKVHVKGKLRASNTVRGC